MKSVFLRFEVISVFLIMLSKQNIEIIKEATKKLHPKQLGIFGSYARGEALPDSDLDILVDYGVQVDLLTLIGIEQELSDVLGLKVDLITRRSVNERLWPYIEKDLISIL